MSQGNALQIVPNTGRAFANGAATVSVPGTINVTLATLAYNAEVAGTYRIEWWATFTRASATTSLLVDGRVDGAAVRSISEEASDASDTNIINVVAFVMLTAGAHTIDFVARGEGNAATTVANPVIAIERWGS